MSDPQAVTFEAYGAPMKLVAWKEPELKPNQLLLKVEACSLNPIDYKLHSGALKMVFKVNLPSGVCYDVAGVVEKTTSSKFKVGQRVAARSLESGTLATHCVVDEAVSALLPDDISFTQAAALPLAGETALQSFRLGGLTEGQSVLISGGAGGVGTYALQLAKHVFKASRVVATCSTGKVEFCHSLGADECLDYTKASFAELKGPFDMIFDTVGNAKEMAEAKLIKPGGKIVSIASLPEPGAFERIGKDPGFLVRSALYLASTPLRWSASPGEYLYCLLSPNAEDLEFLLARMAEGKLKSEIDTVFEGLGKFEEAFEKMKSGRTRGKLIVVPQ